MTISVGFMRHIAACTRYNPLLFMPFVVGGDEVGAVRREIGLVLGQIPEFALAGERLVLAPRHDSFETRTAALARAGLLLSDHYGVPLHGEIYPVIVKAGDSPLAKIDRAAIPWFGVKGCGVHANGFVRRSDGLHLWIARRTASRAVDPGKLDNMIGGGMPFGMTAEDNLAKEAWEEAGLSSDQIGPARELSGRLSYKVEKMKGLRNDTLFVFDLELPEDCLPVNTDGEVDAFVLMPSQEVLEIVRTTDLFKFNCALVLIDFFLRHGLIGPSCPEYDALRAALTTLRTAE